MKSLALAGVCLALMFAACGGQGSSSQSTSETVQPIEGSARPPRIAFPAGPPPKKLVVHDIRKGVGRGIPQELGVRVKTNYVAYGYRADKVVDVRWGTSGGFNIGLGPGKETEGWEKGMVGMKVGGRRELRVPARMAYGEEAIFYVVHLLGIEFPPFGRVPSS
ncbi:MAG: FKBP-type peptidyl-prolyl cis-trans isomerase [Solirubrobacterales bacterium]